MHQPKRANLPSRGLHEGRSPKHNKKQHKVKAIKSKLFRNLNEIPIQLTQDPRLLDHLHHEHPPRTHSALEEDHNICVHKALRAIRAESSLSQYQDHRESHHQNRKRLSLDSTGKRYERESLASRNSVTKKMSRNTRGIEENMKVRLAEQRKKSNVSCASACEEGYGKTSKKHSVKLKRPSVSNLSMAPKGKGKENRSPKNNKLGDKSRSKSRNPRRKSTVQLDRSKASTTFINTCEKGFIKKKQSTSTAHIGPCLKKKKKQVKKRSPRPEQADQFSLEQYPINKYNPCSTTHKQQPRQSTKPRSKSRKGSSSKQPKKTASLAEIDYMSCINMPSNSSGLIISRNSEESRHSSNNIKIIDNWEYRYFQDNSGSVDLDEIRYYESFHYSRRKQEQDFIDRNFRNEDKYHHRRLIEQDVQEDYPQFEELELKFLTSVIFIQRKWREYRLYKQVFRNLTTSDHKLAQMSQEQSSSKPMNISSAHKSPIKFTQLERGGEKEESLKKELFKDKSPPLSHKLRNNLYLDFREIGDDQGESQEEEEVDQLQPKIQEHPVEQEHEDEHPEHSVSNLSARSYQFLSNQLFPNMSYIMVKQQQLKDELQLKISRVSQLERKGTIDGREFLKLKAQFESQYEKDIRQFNKSRKDVKKGYLSFIETCRHIKQENGLRRVSSESGPMALLYCKIFNLDHTHQNSSESSDSMRRLTKKVLIRREFVQTQKIDPSVFSVPQEKAQSARDRPRKKAASSLSARLGRQSELLSSLSPRQGETLCFNRVKEGLLVSPQPGELSPTLFPEPICHQQDDSEATRTFERKERLLMEEIVAILTHELFVELIRIDENRETIIDILAEPTQPLCKISAQDIRDFEIVDESQSIQLGFSERDEKGEREDDFEIVEEFKFREIFRIEGLGDHPEISLNRRHRNSHTHNISPASSQSFPFQAEQILHYAKQLLAFLARPQLQNDIIRKLNKNQGFTPKEYLKFLRDFEIPEQEYDPLISNEIFIEWEDKFYHNQELPSDDDPYSKRQAVTVFHRCIFECIIGLLEDCRPSGDKGEPFPWENTAYFSRPLTPQTTPRIFEKGLSSLSELIELKCGLIEEKQLILSEEDMERQHEENEDRIITMLEGELLLSPHCWYEIEQHGLEIKLEVEAEIYEYIMLEALDELLEIL